MRWSGWQETVAPEPPLLSRVVSGGIGVEGESSDGDAAAFGGRSGWRADMTLSARLTSCWMTELCREKGGATQWAAIWCNSGEQARRGAWQMVYLQSLLKMNGKARMPDSRPLTARQ